MPAMSSEAGHRSVPLLLFDIYKQNRSLLLNLSYLVLITAAFSGTTFARANEDKTTNKAPGGTLISSEMQKSQSLNTTAEEKKKHPKISKGSFRRLIQSAIPSATDATVIYFSGHLVLLVVRAYLTIKVATLDGKLVGALVSKRLKRFVKLLVYWMLLGIPASVVNASLNWTKSKFRQHMRINMNRSIIMDYLPDSLDPNYYSLVLFSEGKISDPDQRIATDVSRLASALASLPGQLLKPTLDLLLCARELGKSGVGSGEGTLALGIIAHFSTMILRLVSPPFARLAADKARLEGQLRSAHSRIVTNSEEIAFLKGHPRELDIIDRSYYQLEGFLKMDYWKRAIHQIAQTFIVKYFWGAAGLVLCSAPVFINQYLGQEPDPNASGDFITNRRLLLSASDSLDKLIYARKYILQVVGHASRVSSFQDSLRKIVKDRALQSSNNVQYGDEITFKDVRLITPADVTLIPKLNFSLKRGNHLLIAGPNGSGKSSLFRMLGGLWPCKEGQIIIPETENMFYLPQRAYLCKGTLREQVIYPFTLEQYASGKRNKKTDRDLIEIMRALDLDEVFQGDPYGSLDSIRNWNEELSVGAQQRLAMARLYYHQPMFAVLDECTSAVSPAMEQFMYEHAQTMGITLLSVAHRSALWHFHNYILKFDGKGGYYFGPLDATKRLKYEDERLDLEKNLRDVPNLRERLAELKKVSNAQHIRISSYKSLVELGRQNYGL